MRKKVWVFAGVLAFFLASVLPLRAEESQIVVSAAGTVSAKPDMAEFGVVVNSTANRAEKAAAETAEKYRTVQSALRSAGIPLEDAPSVSYTVSPEWEWDQATAKNNLKGYSARHTIRVKVRTLGSIGRAIDAAVQGGANEVQGVTFLSSRYEPLRQEALALAVRNARRDGEIMARAAGGRLGQLIEVSVSRPSLPVRSNMEFMAMKAAPSPAPTEIAPSEQDIAVTVSSRWRYIASPVK